MAQTLEIKEVVKVLRSEGIQKDKVDVILQELGLNPNNYTEAEIQREMVLLNTIKDHIKMNMYFNKIGTSDVTKKQMGGLYHIPGTKENDVVRDYAYKEDDVRVNITKKLGIAAASRALSDSSNLDYVINKAVLDISEIIGCKPYEPHLGEFIRVVSVKDMIPSAGYEVLFTSLAMPFEVEKRKVRALNEN